MTQPIKKFLAPFQPHMVVFDTPKRQSFTLKRFKGLVGAVKLLWFARKNPSYVKAADAYNAAIKAHGLGRFNDAEALYNECIRHEPEHEPAYTNLAALLIERNSQDLAIEELKKALRIRPFYFRGYYNLGLVYYQTGHIKEAIDMFQQAIRFNEKHFWSLVMLGEICAAKRDLDGALDYYEQALPHCDTPHAIHMRMAEFFLQNRDLPACETHIQKALATKPQPELFYNLGWLYAIQEKDPEEIVNQFLLAVKHKSNFKEAYLNLALAQGAAGYNEQSVKNMQHYVEEFGKHRNREELLDHMNYLRLINPANYLAGMKVAELYLEVEQVQKGIRVLDEILEENPKYAPAVVMLADLYRHMGRHKDAIKYYRMMIEVDASNVSGYLGLARSYGDIENFAAATPVLRKVLELEPNNTDVHYQYATLMAQEGNLTVALKHYKIVSTLDATYPRIQKRLRMLEEEIDEHSEVGQSAWPGTKPTRTKIVQEAADKHLDK